MIFTQTIDYTLPSGHDASWYRCGNDCILHMSKEAYIANKAHLEDLLPPGVIKGGYSLHVHELPYSYHIQIRVDQWEYTFDKSPGSINLPKGYQAVTNINHCSCGGKFIKYKGLFDEFEYCEKCDARKEQKHDNSKRS